MSNGRKPREFDMQQRLEALQRLHRDLDRRIALEERGPAACSVRLSAMKRDRLRLKDQIARLGRPFSPAV